MKLYVKGMEVEPVTSWSFETITELVEQKDKIIEKAFSILELWEKSKVYGSDDARNQRGEAIMELFQMLKKYDEGRYLYIIDKYWKEL